MARIEKLCSTPEYTKYFKDIQRLGKFDLFTRFDDIESIVNKKIDEKYRHFLSTPIVEGDSITWFSKPYSETPQRLSELQGEDRSKYEQIKNETLNHYKSVANSLRQEGKSSEAECFENATKFVNDDFVYCFDDKTVLGIWGMQLRENVREPLGIAMKNIFVKKPKLQPQSEIKPSAVDDFPPELEPSVADDPQPELEQQPEELSENPFNVRFNAGEGGILDGILEYTKHNGDTVKETEVPQVKAKKGYEFIGWDKDPNNYTVAGDTEFTAQYREIQPVVTPLIPWWRGCLNWLLLLLLLALIFMVVWCCLLKKCNFNFCGCGCPEDTTTIVTDTIKPPIKPDTIKPDTIKPPQPPQTVEGTEFWLTFGANAVDGHSLSEVDLQIRIVSGASPATGTIHFTNLGTSVDFNIPARQVYTYNLNNAQKQAVYNTKMEKSNRSIYITSNESVTVYALNQLVATTDATNVLPVTALGTEYYQISYAPHPFYLDAYAVVGVKNNTRLYHDGTLAATLDVGDVYYGTSKTDMTGAHITADNSVAFFAVNQGTNIPVGITAADCLMQQLPPVNTWGKNFFVPVSHRTRDIVRIVASRDSTNITQTGGRLLFPARGQKNLTNLRAGQFVELEVSLKNNGCFIQADKPVGVCAYLTGCSYNPGGISDPAQSWLPAIEQTATETLIAPFIPTGSTALNAHYALVITPTATKDDTKVSIGGATATVLSGGSWRDNAAASMSFYTMPLTKPTASYNFTNQAGLIIMCYGVGSAESYYFLAYSAMRNLSKSLK